MGLRIRQVVFAADDLETTAAAFADVLTTQVVFRDPQVASFGLVNALLPVGDQFVEVIAPTRSDAAAARHLVRHGDSGYMLILQADDLAGDRLRLQHLGVRLVWESSYPDMSAIHLHPKDLGGAIVSLDQPVPAQAWRWAGPAWQPGGVPGAMIREVSIAGRHPAVLAQRWAEVLGMQAAQAEAGTWEIPLTAGHLRFVTSDQADHINEMVIERQGSPTIATICGTRVRMIQE